MENSAELRLCRFGPGGLSTVRSSPAGVAGLDDGGRDAECECETLTATGLGGFCTVTSGRSAWHISQAVSSAWFKKVQRGHCFLLSGVEGRGAASGWGCGREGCRGALLF
jgi:hypothetical protein